MSRPYALAGRSHALGGEQHIDAAAGSEIEHGLPFMKVGDHQRVAASEAGEDRFVGELAPLGDVVELLTQTLLRVATTGFLVPVVRRVALPDRLRGGGVAIADLFAEFAHPVFLRGVAFTAGPASADLRSSIGSGKSQ
jgi:hypothetical protein